MIELILLLVLGPTIVWLIIRCHELKKILNSIFYIPITDEEFDRERWIEIREVVFKRDGYKCLKCGHNNPRHLTAHHIIPKSKGGTDDPENLETLCWKCHCIEHGFRLPYYMRKKRKRKKKKRH